ncbi:hypothetical protein [Deinococcus planocerae]|uniref:hypothetical protein n=1 Tax=Deinococcus planocerae TaxID=1737569 RepID=UPI001FE75AB6|nr:hypothetical protein [Deinococcus planocerae]
MELRLLGLDEAAEEFLWTYEAITGRRVENLGLWELAAAVRSMPDPASGLPEWRALGTVEAEGDVVGQRLRRFIAEALRR